MHSIIPLHTKCCNHQLLVQAILRRSEAAKQFKALGDGNVLAEFYWSTKTHGFYDCSPASRVGFETVLHVACRLDFKAPARSTGHRTRKITARPMHLPLELWHHILSFLRRSDLDADADSRLKLEEAPVNDVNSRSAQKMTPLMAAAELYTGRNSPDSAAYTIVKMLLDCPSLDKNATKLSYAPCYVRDSFGQLSAANRSACLDGLVGQPLSLVTHLMVAHPDVDTSETNAIHAAALRHYQQERDADAERYTDCYCGNCGGYVSTDGYDSDNSLD